MKPKVRPAEGLSDKQNPIIFFLAEQELSQPLPVAQPCLLKAVRIAIFKKKKIGSTATVAANYKWLH